MYLDLFVWYYSEFMVLKEVAGRNETLTGIMYLQGQ